MFLFYAKNRNKVLNFKCRLRCHIWHDISLKAKKNNWIENWSVLFSACWQTWTHSPGARAIDRLQGDEYALRSDYWMLGISAYTSWQSQYERQFYVPELFIWANVWISKRQREGFVVMIVAYDPTACGVRARHLEKLRHTIYLPMFLIWSYALLNQA